MTMVAYVFNLNAAIRTIYGTIGEGHYFLEVHDAIGRTFNYINVRYNKDLCIKPCEMGCGVVFRFTTSPEPYARGQQISRAAMDELWRIYGVFLDDRLEMLAGNRPGGMGRARKLGCVDKCRV